MATGKRRRARKPRPEDRIDDLFFAIQGVKRRWSRGPRWEINTRQEVRVESSDTLEIAGVSSQKNALEIGRVELAIHSRDRNDLDDREFLGLCDRVRGDRALLNAYLWLPLEELMALAPALMDGQLVEVELRIRGFFRGKGRIRTIEFLSQKSAFEDWAVEARQEGWVGEWTDSRRAAEASGE
jgi:hypothetical protein